MKYWRTSAAAPARRGLESEVPDEDDTRHSPGLEYPLDDVIPTPGAITSGLIRPSAVGPLKSYVIM